MELSEDKKQQILDLVNKIEKECKLRSVNITCGYGHNVVCIACGLNLIRNILLGKDDQSK